MQANVQAYLSEKVDNIATFRYPSDLLEKLEDVIHQIRKAASQKADETGRSRGGLSLSPDRLRRLR